MDFSAISSEREWKKQLLLIETPFEMLEKNKNIAKKKLSQALEMAISHNKAKKFGVLFSGGIDSTIIALFCKKLGLNFKCYTVGLKNSHDILAAEKAASELKLDLKTKTVGIDEFEETLKKVINIIKEPDVTKAGVGSVVYSASLLAKKDKISALFSGLGSEELFTGYQRHELAFSDYQSVHKECWNGLKKMWKRDIERDMLISKNLKTTLMLPFLDFNVIQIAMSIHPMHKISRDSNICL